MQTPHTAPRPICLNSLFIYSLHFAELKNSSLFVDQFFPLIAPEGHISLHILQRLQGFTGYSVGLSNSQLLF